MEEIVIGRKSEKNLAKLLRKFGFWAYNIPVTIVGQPCDIVAAKKKISLFIDSKHTSKKPSFTFERIEPNQISAMKYMTEFAELENVGFAIYFEREEKWYWMPFKQYEAWRLEDKKSAHMSELIPLEDMINEINH